MTNAPPSSMSERERGREQGGGHESGDGQDLEPRLAAGRGQGRRVGPAPSAWCRRRRASAPTRATQPPYSTLISAAQLDGDADHDQADVDQRAGARRLGAADPAGPLALRRGSTSAQPTARPTTSRPSTQPTDCSGDGLPSNVMSSNALSAYAHGRNGATTSIAPPTMATMRPTGWSRCCSSVSQVEAVHARSTTLAPSSPGSEDQDQDQQDEGPDVLPGRAAELTGNVSGRHHLDRRPAPARRPRRR